MHPSSTEAATNPHVAVTVACVALFTDMLLYGILIPVLPLLPAVAEAGASATGLLFAAYAAALVIVTPIAGRVVDKRGPRGPLLAALVGLAGACLLFTIGGPYWMLLTARTLQGAAAGLSWVAGLSLIAATVPLRQRGTYLGLAMSMVSVGVLAGPPLAGWLAGLGGRSTPFLCAIVLLVIDGGLRVAFVRPTPPPDDDPATAMDVLRTPGCRPEVALILFGAAAAAVGLVLVGIGPNLPVLITGLVCLGVAIALLVVPAGALIGVQGAIATPPTIGGAYSLYNLAYAGGLVLGPAAAILARLPSRFAVMPG
ncbi:MFS transporter [Actinomyces sp. 594]|uniref:MFS transporter n=1 Tax=Actinomyces sp. 594 TaxID=2057793 RepID=UPI00214B2D0C|nr:MFS transporter [Actinomyces sp. 594]